MYSPHCMYGREGGRGEGGREGEGGEKGREGGRERGFTHDSEDTWFDYVWKQLLLASIVIEPLQNS